MKEEEIKKLNIYEKMDMITNELGIVEKGLSVEISKTRSYKAVSERDILDNVKPLEHKYRVYSYPYDRKIVENDTLIKKTEYQGNVTETNSLYMRIETIYRFVNLDNTDEYIDIKAYGDGIDTGDKATGKAMTYSDKYALMKGYKISTGDDPDKEASPQVGYVKEINYRQELINYCNNNDLNMNEIAVQYKLNGKSKNQEFKKVLEELKEEED